MRRTLLAIMLTSCATRAMPVSSVVKSGDSGGEMGPVCEPIACGGSSGNLGLGVGLAVIAVAVVAGAFSR